MIFGTEEIRN